jgi:hypothetical protein
MTPADLDELREIFHPLIRDIDSDDFPVINAASLAARKDAAAR